MAITDKQMQSKPTDKDQWFADDWGRGDGRFLGRITPKGRACFYFRYTRPDGKRDTLPIGDYSKDGKGGLTLAEARETALQWSRLYKAGATNLREHLAEQERLEAESIAEKRRLEEAAKAKAEAEALALAGRLTVRQLFQRWKETELAPRKTRSGKREGRKDGGEQIEMRFRLHVFPVIGDEPAETVRRGKVMEILDKLSGEAKLRTHNLVLTELRQMYKFGQVRELVGHDPTAGIKGKEKGKGSRWLRPEEIKLLAKALPTCGLGPRLQIAVWLQLSTACRIGELAQATWGEIDFEKKVWHIPASHTKNGKPHLVHLSALALKQLEALHTLREDDKGFLFPTHKGSKRSGTRECTGHMLPSSVSKQLASRQMTEETRLKGRTPHFDALALPFGHWTSHDLRRTAASMMSKLKVRKEVIHKCLNHTLDDELAEIYVHDEMLDERKAAFEALGNLIDTLAHNKPTDNVVPLHGTA